MAKRKRVYEVNVTRNHIAHALERESTQCAIAIALREASPNISRPRVDQKTIRFTDLTTGMRYTFKTPDAAAKFIDDFDHGRNKARPFFLNLDEAEALKVEPIRRAQPSTLLKMAATYRERGRTMSKGATTPNAVRELR